jgi:hypothetical protein
MELVNQIPLRLWPLRNVILPENIKVRVIDCCDELEPVVEVYKLDEAA